VLNLSIQTAKTLGLTIPETLLATAEGRRAAWNAHGDLGELALLTIIDKDSVISLSRTIHG
jgi:hypothetical protein